MADRCRGLVVMDEASLAAHVDDEHLARLGELVTLGDPVWSPELDSPAARRRLAQIEVLITSWGVPTLTAERLAAAPALRAVFHCAGSARPVLGDDPEPFWTRGIRISTAADANAVPVAEFTLAAIIFAGKRAPFLARSLTADDLEPLRRNDLGDLSNYRRTIGVVGFSRIGRRVVHLLQALEGVTVLVADPFADPLEVAAAGGRLVDLADLLPAAAVLSLHAPSLPSTRHLIGAQELSLLPDHATVVNTARGALIDHDALARECGSGRLFAMLDVTEPEPLPADSILRRLPTVMLTPHIAGSLGTEVRRLTDHALAELERWTTGVPLHSEVTREAYARNA